MSMYQKFPHGTRVKLIKTTESVMLDLKGTIVDTTNPPYPPTSPFGDFCYFLADNVSKVPTGMRWFPFIALTSSWIAKPLFDSVEKGITNSAEYEGEW